MAGLAMAACLLFGLTMNFAAYGQTSVTIKTEASQTMVLEVYGAEDATVDAKPVERTSPNGERLYGAYDINLTKDGNEWQPEPDEPAIVAMTDPMLEDGRLYDIYHEGKDGIEYVATVAAENGKIVFPAQSFSVYIVTETGDYARLKVTFHRADGTAISLYVKKADIAQGDYNTIVYNPGMGAVPAGVACKGWTTNASYTATDIASAMTFAMVRTAIQTRLNTGVTDGEEMHFYTMLFKSYYVTYLDEAGAVLKTDDFPYRADAAMPTTSYTVTAAYIPNDNDHNFEGWKVNTHADGAYISGHTDDNHVYENDDPITITGGVTFKVHITKGHWLIYHENGKGATYKAADFVKSDEVTVEPSLEMTRNGYTFQGWYLGEPSEEGGNPTGAMFSFGNLLNENTHIYAKWRANTTAPYTVIIWKQNIEANGYDYAEAISLTGTVGDIINTVTQQGTGNGAYARVNGANKRYTGFHLNQFDQNVRIATEGNSVLNVYYDRNSYTLTFRKDRNGTVYKTITALYEQSIGSNFPITDNGASAEWRWEPQSSSTFNEVLVYIDAMPAENVTFYRNTSTASTKYMRFYVEVLPGQAGTRTYNGVNFAQYGNTITAKYNWFTEAEDFVTLTGYSKYGSEPAFVNGRADVSTGGTLYLYYLREKYPINFMDGAYYDGNGNRLTGEIDQGQIDEITDIAYGADIRSYDAYRPNAEDTPIGFVFEGWYVDKLCQQAYNFTTMPKGGVTVYAKWRKIQYRVFLHPGIDAASVPRLDWGSASQAMNFRRDYNDKISVPTGIDLDDNYKFVGWFTDAACTHPFNETAITLTDANTTLYNKTTDFTDPMDEYGVGATWNSDAMRDATTPRVPERFWITRKYDIYGKWKATLPGAIGITVVYDGNGGTPASDTAQHKYQDDVEAIAHNACTPPSADKEFSHWVMQRYNTTTRVFEDVPGSRIYPADAFTVLKSNAKQYILEWCDPDNASDIRIPDDPYNVAPPDATHRLISKAIYTLILRAEYVDVEQPSHSFITWYKNDGTGAIVRADKETTTPHTLPINMTVTEFDGTTPTIPAAPTRTGYTFKGWYKQRTPEGSTVPTTIEQCTPNFLYYKNNKYYKESTFTNEVTKVAADLYQKDDYLYAIWEPIVDFNFEPICGGESVTLPTTTTYGVDLSAASYTWSATAGSVSGTTYTLPLAGPATVTFTPATSTCAQPKSFIFPINPKPAVTFSPIAGTLCPSATNQTITGSLTTPGTPNYTYTWTIGDLTAVTATTISNTTSATPSIVVDIPNNCNATYPITLTVLDAAGCSNSYTVSDAIKVLDITTPVIIGTLPEITITGCTAADKPAPYASVAALAAALTGSGAGITDACTPDLANMTLSYADGTVSGGCTKTFTRTYTVKDACGNGSTISQSIKIVDDEAPVVIGSLPDLTVEGCSFGDAPMKYESVEAFKVALQGAGANVTDNCASLGNMTLTVSDGPVSGTCDKTFTRTYRVKDTCNNQSSEVTQTIGITFPDNISITGGTNSKTVECVSEIALPHTLIPNVMPNVTDACGSDLSAQRNVASPVSTWTIDDCEGTRAYAYTYTDCAGHTRTWTFTYTIAHSTAPAEVGGPVATSSTVGVSGCGLCSHHITCGQGCVRQHSRRSGSGHDRQPGQPDMRGLSNLHLYL